MPQWALHNVKSIRPVVAGLVLGMAARPTLGNLIAGIQIALTQPIRIDDAVAGVMCGKRCWTTCKESTLERFPKFVPRLHSRRTVNRDRIASSIINWHLHAYDQGLVPASSGARTRECYGSTRRESGEIGRRTRLRIWRGNPWGFESPLSHQNSLHQQRTMLRLAGFAVIGEIDK